MDESITDNQAKKCHIVSQNSLVYFGDMKQRFFRYETTLRKDEATAVDVEGQS